MEDLTPHIVITGANSGIGQAAAIEMARRGWRVTLVGRDPARLDSAFSLVSAAAAGPAPTALRADFADLKQIHALAEQLSGRDIEVLANNAGLVTKSPELTMRVNHLAPFLLTHLLRPQLKPGARIVNTASQFHAMGRLTESNLDGVKGVWKTYGMSKAANIMFAAEAARRWPELLSFSLHPGVVRSAFGTPWAKLYYRIMPGLDTVEEGADQIVWLSTAPADQLVNGAYYVKRQVTRPHPSTDDAAVAARVWEATAARVL